MREEETANLHPVVKESVSKRAHGYELGNFYFVMQDDDWSTIDYTASLAKSANSNGAFYKPSNNSSCCFFHLHIGSLMASLTCGFMLGCLGVFCDACTQWVSAFRTGICAQFFWLSNSMCCIEEAQCPEYYTWSRFLLGRDSLLNTFVDATMYIFFSTLAALLASFLCTVYAPYAAGGGIGEVKTIISGHRVKRYLGGWTLATKVVSMCFSTGSGLVVGKEGPFVHIGACVGGLVANIFPSYQSQHKKRELMTAGTGGAIAVAFGAPLGGVIFALEEVSFIYNFSALMSALICGVTAVLVQSHVNLWHTGRIVQFSVNYRHNWNFFELPLFAVMGCFGGFIGAAFNVANLHVNRWRKAHIKQWRLTEVSVVAVVTAVVNLLIPFGTGSLLELLGDCFQDCTPGSPIMLCQGETFENFISLLIAASCKAMLFFYTIGIFLPAGVLVPSLVIGALYGRAFGIVLRCIQENWPTAYIFSECSDQELCVIPGAYAIVGAAATLTGVSHMTICLVIIMFELTGSLEYIVPVVIGVLCAKGVVDALGVSSTYEIGIEENNLPYLDPKKEFHLHYRAEDVYKGQDIIFLTAYGMTVRRLTQMLRERDIKGYPVVWSENDRKLLGYAPTKNLVCAIEAAKMRDNTVSLDTYIRFTHTPSQLLLDNFFELDFTDIMEDSLLHVEPGCTVKKLLRLFQSLGTHHVLVTQYSNLKGYISKKDLIKFMRKKEQEESIENEDIQSESQQRFGECYDRPNGRSL